MKIHIKHRIDDHIPPDDFIKLLLKDRGIENTSLFITPAHPTEIPLKSFFTEKPSFKKDWQAFIKLLKKIHEDQSMIVVYSDYDADGVTGGAVMWETLHILGFKVMPYIPDRKKEGYGFSETGLNNVKETYDPALIISVDHGIVAHKQITYAKEKLGLAIVVTDHHQKQEKEPEDAFAVFHTTQLSGSGVSYFVAKEIAEEFGKPAKSFNEFSRDFIALAATGTIADLVPLVGVSRSVAKYGLEAYGKSVRYGIRHLLKESGLDGKPITPYEVGYIIAPRINAFGRLEHAMDALRLLCTKSYAKAIELAGKAGKINKDRQNLVTVAQKQAERMADGKQKIIIVRNDEWEEGIIGLIAGKLMNKYSRPTIVMTRSDGHAKASVRSVSGVDITKFLTSKEIRKYLTDVGGHAAAAGFTVPLENVDDFTIAAFAKAEKEITDDMLVPSLDIDFEIPIKSATLDLAKKLSQLEPFGIGNPQPLFVSQGKIKDIILFGKQKQYTRYLLHDGDMAFLEITFFEKPNKALKIGDTVSIAYNLKIDTWGGKIKLSAMGRYIINDVK
jgi:single-stranded-DNA-specific exonuclease